MRKGNGMEISVPYEGSFFISYMPLTLNLFQKNCTTNLNSADREGYTEQ